MKYYLFSLVLWNEILFYSRFKPTGHTPEGVSSRNSDAPEATNRGLAKKLTWCVDFYKLILFFICDLPTQLFLFVCGFVFNFLFQVLPVSYSLMSVWKSSGTRHHSESIIPNLYKKCKGGVSKEVLKSLVLGGIKLQKKVNGSPICSIHFKCASCSS